MRTSGQITTNLLVRNLHIPYKYTHGDLTFFLAYNFGTYLATTSGEKHDGRDGQDGQEGQDGQDGRTGMAFKLDLPRNLCRVAIAILKLYTISILNVHHTCMYV